MRFANRLAAAATLAAVTVSITANIQAQSIGSEVPLQRLNPFDVLKERLGPAGRSFNKKEIDRMMELAQTPEIKAEVKRLMLAERDKDRENARKYNLRGGDLYRNPVVAEWVNQVGQNLVPPHSANTYVFRVLENPLPRSYCSSSGSIYVTTGLLALLGSEGQLAYLLAHEIAHLERGHFYDRYLGQTVEAALIHEKQTKKSLGGFLRGVVTAGTQSLLGDQLGGLAGQALINALAGPQLPTLTDWNRLHEEDADRYGLRLALRANYDTSDAVAVMLALRREIKDDPRIESSLHLNLIPIDEKIEQVSRIQKEELSALWEEKKSDLLGTSPRFHFTIAQVRRDNGIRAVEEDLFKMARRNLEKSIAIRSDDALTHLYLGKVYTWARREDLTLKAQHHLEQSIRWDSERNLLPEPHLELALLLLREDNPRHFPRVQKELRSYVRLFVQNNGFYRRPEDAMPPGLRYIYDHLRLTGDPDWRLEDDVEEAVQEKLEDQ